MVNQQLVDYVRAALELGYPLDEIRNKFFSVGYDAKTTAAVIRKAETKPVHVWFVAIFTGVIICFILLIGLLMWLSLYG